jgi:cytoskeleton protein RodZ
MSDSTLTTSDQRPGQRLKEARESLSWSIDEVAAKLKLKPRQVQAMEADAYGELPGATFVRGFMRNYAKLVQLDPEQLLSGLRGEAARDSPTVSAPHAHIQYVERPYKKSNRALLAAAAAIFATAVGLVTLWRWDGSLQRAGQPPGSEVPATSPAPGASAPQAAAPASEPAPATAVAPSAVGQPQTGATSDVKPGAAAASNDAAIPPPADASGKPESISPPPPVTPEKASVKLSFDTTSWVQVKDGRGKVVFTRTGQPGGEHEFAATLPLKFIIGNAAKVKMTYNGEPFDLMPHLEGTVARFTLE